MSLRREGGMRGRGERARVLVVHGQKIKDPTGVVVVIILKGFDHNQ